MFSIIATYHFLFHLYVWWCPWTISKFLQCFLKLVFFWYIFRKTFNFNKVFSFSKANVFIAWHLSKIYLRSQRKAWFYLAQNFIFRFKNIRFFIQKKRGVPWKQLFLNFLFFLKSTCLLLATFLKFILKQKEKCGFILKKELFLENSCSWISKI